MKKLGFTLAEVLITLAIIGVVATITLPSLMSNTQEQQAVTAFRKAMNTLNEVPQMNAAVDGFDYGGIAIVTAPSDRDVYDANGLLEQSIWAMFASKAQVDVTKSGSAGAMHPNCGNFGTNANVIAFRDGTMLCYSSITRTIDRPNAVIRALVDTNGIKAPNQLSTCRDPNCADKSQKRIRDQFEVTLYKTMALPGRIEVSDNGTIGDSTMNVPQTHAARWAMSK